MCLEDSKIFKNQLKDEILMKLTYNICLGFGENADIHLSLFLICLKWYRYPTSKLIGTYIHECMSYLFTNNIY